MSEPTIETLARRLEQVERKHRRLKWVIGLLAVGLLAASAYLSGQATNSAIESVDLRLKYGLLTLPQPSHVKVEGNRGTVWLDSGFDIPNHGPGLSIYDKKGEGQTRISLRLGKDDAPHLVLYDEGGNLRIALGSVTLVVTRPGPGGSKVEVEEKIPAGLVFFDKNGKVIWRAP